MIKTIFVGVALHSDLQYNIIIQELQAYRKKNIWPIFSKIIFESQNKRSKEKGNIIGSLLKVSKKGNRAVWHYQNPKAIYPNCQ